METVQQSAEQSDTRHRLPVKEICKILRDALKRRSGRAWSVTNDRGTAWGWITISSQPKARVRGSMTDADREELAKLLGLKTVHHQGESIPAGDDYYREYIQRAETGTATTFGKPYWD
jgi:hypothetical protein